MARYMITFETLWESDSPEDAASKGWDRMVACEFRPFLKVQEVSDDTGKLSDVILVDLND